LIQEVKHGLSRHKRQAQRRKDGVVPSRIINFRFHDGLSLSAKILFLKVALAWKKDTCIKFVESNTETSILVRADNGRECSYTDNNPRAKMMYIGCGYFGGVAHEVGHALGLEHTHIRHDRDDYLIVNWTNVEKEFKEMAQKIPGLKLEVNNSIYGCTVHRIKNKLQAYQQQYKHMTEEENENYGVPYDYGSIMHYGSSGPNPTMIPKDKNYHRTMGSALISFTDLALVNKHYNCEGMKIEKPHVLNQHTE
ncbi:astacin, partial [Ancylostoma caninum]